MTVADEIADHLAAEGITHAFGIIGGGNVTLWDAIAKKIEIVCCHHEQAAAQAGTYYYRTCGRLAPVIITSGAGSANAITGVMAANMDSIPLLVLAGNEKLSDLVGKTRILGLQGYDSAALARGFTKWSQTCWTAGEALPLLKKGIEKAITPRQGAVWITIPRDIQGAVAV